MFTSYGVCAGTALPPKRSPGGRRARLVALGGWLPGLSDALLARPPGVAVHDALDAAIAAWSAARWLRGDARVLPAADPPRDPPRDQRGRFMEIVA